MKSLLVGFSIFIGILYIGIQLILFNPSVILSQSPQPDLAEHIVDFLFIGKELPQEFGEREVKHMQDVRSLYYQISYRMLFTILFGIILCLHSVYMRKFNTAFVKKCIFISLLFQGFFVALLIAAGLFFSQSFILFHKLFFTNDLWILSPESATIQAFPYDFFYIITTFLIAYLLASFIATFVSYNLVKKYDTHNL